MSCSQKGKKEAGKTAIPANTAKRIQVSSQSGLGQQENFDSCQSTRGNQISGFVFHIAQRLVLQQLPQLTIITTQAISMILIVIF